MIELNGKKFAENDKEFTSSLFETGGTCVGYYKVNKKSISLQNPQKDKIGVINIHGVLGSARKVDNGWWYSYATIKEVGEYESYKQSCEEPLKYAEKLLGCNFRNTYHLDQSGLRV